MRVTRDETEIKALRGTSEVRMRAPKGTVLEVIHIEGDRYKHRDSNWYWVLLPRDPWATRPAGWIRGDAIEHVLPPEPAGPALAAAPKTVPSDVPPVKEARTETRTEPRRAAAPERAPVEDVPVAEPVIFSDVVLNFQFGRSELTEEAKRKLASAVTMPKPNARLSIALEGHADWTGPEAYNEQLGLDRAETVRRYLAELLRIPAGTDQRGQLRREQPFGTEHDAGRSRPQPPRGDQGRRIRPGHIARKGRRCHWRTRRLTPHA